MRIGVALVVAIGIGCRGADSQEKRNEFVAAYSVHRADVSALTTHPGPVWQNGASLAYSRKLTDRFAVVLDVSGNFRRGSLTETVPPFAGLLFRTKRDQYYLLGGIRYRPPANGRLSPFVHALAGGALFRGFAESRAENNIFMFDNAASAAIAAGGGVDVRVRPHFGVRLLAIDYMPTFFASQLQHNFRASFGLFYRW